MFRLTLASAAVFLFTAVALSVALFAVSGASEAEQDVPEGPAVDTPSSMEPPVAQGTANSPSEPSLNQSWKESASETQYSNDSNEDEDYYDHPEPPQDVGSPHVRMDMPATVYHDFYTRWLARKDDVKKVSKIKDTPSEGSAPGVRAPAKALSVMEPPTPYSQIVDNASPRHFFSGRAWKKSSRGAKHYGRNYEYIKPTKDASPASFKVKIPTTGYYTVYARWPAAKGNNPAARFRIETASGLKQKKVNQRKDGDVWVRLGTYKMKAGNRHPVQVAGRSKAEGRVVADAVRVVKGTQAAHPKGETDRDLATEGATGGGEKVAGGKAAGQEVVRRARTHIGTPYRHSPPQPCQAYRSEDCSCLTSLVFGKWLTLPDDPVRQWQVGRSIEKSALRPGDLVFFKEAGESNPITHVAIYSGSGNIIHASSYWGKVVERPMKYVSGYYGAKRLN